MAENKHTASDLYQMQALPLSAKLRMTERRILDWVDYYGDNNVAVSFSGGKDSAVLMDIVRNRLNLKISAVFVDVPTQYPELKEYALTWDNVEVLKPKISFMDVCDKYGFPLISKEVSQAIYEARSVRNNGRDLSTFYRIKQLNGTAVNPHTGKLSPYNIPQYKFFLDAPFTISNKCCDAMKKKPFKEYCKQTGRKMITAVMASESKLRTQHWIKHGCNAFELKEPKSNPMSFWTDQDVLQYIKENNLPICSVYGEVVEDWDRFDGVEGQMTFSDLAGEYNMRGFDAEKPRLKTTGCKRTGCMLCGFGCHLEKEGEGRFELLKKTHPKMYNLLDIVKNNGVTMREAIEWANEHGNLNIRL